MIESSLVSLRTDLRAVCDLFTHLELILVLSVAHNPEFIQQAAQLLGVDNPTVLSPAKIEEIMLKEKNLYQEPTGAIIQEEAEMPEEVSENFSVVAERQVEFEPRLYHFGGE